MLNKIKKYKPNKIYISSDGPRKDFSKGGLVGEETIQGPEVPFTQDNAADRINPITGLPYNQPLIKYQ